MSPLRAALLLPVLVLVMLWAQSACALRRRLTSVPDRSLLWASPNYTIYHRQDDLLREVETIVKANPGFMKMEVLSAADGNYAAELKVVTVEPGGFSQQQPDKIRMLLDFGEHGREFISSELGLLLLRTLADPEGHTRVWPEDPERGRRLGQLLRATYIKILPMENEGGRRLVEAGRLCERKNGRGVDPNRNWPIDWGRKEPDYDPNEEYPGTAPFSEPEVKLLSDLAAGFAPQVWLNIHSGMEAMFVPWDHKATVPDGAQDSLRILERIQADVMAGTTCAVGSGGKTVGYLAHGTATDYMFEALRVPVAYTWEIYGDFGAHFDDCFRMFNPVDEAGVQAVLQRWLKAIFRLLELIPQHPALKDAKAWSLAAADQPANASDGGAGGGVGAVTNGAPGQAAAPKGTDASSSAGAADTATVPAQGQGAAAAQAPAPGPGGGSGPTTTPGAASAGTTGTAAQAGSPGAAASGGGGQQQQAPTQPALRGTEQEAGATEPVTSESETRVAVVASRLGFGGGATGALASGALAVSGLAVVGLMLYRKWPHRSNPILAGQP